MSVVGSGGATGWQVSSSTRVNGVSTSSNRGSCSTSVTSNPSSAEKREGGTQGAMHRTTREKGRSVPGAGGLVGLAIPPSSAEPLLIGQALRHMAPCDHRTSCARGAGDSCGHVIADASGVTPRESRTSRGEWRPSAESCGGMAVSCGGTCLTSFGSNIMNSPSKWMSSAESERGEVQVGAVRLSKPWFSKPRSSAACLESVGWLNSPFLRASARPPSDLRAPEKSRVSRFVRPRDRRFHVRAAV